MDCKRRHGEVEDLYCDFPEVGKQVDRSSELDSRDRLLAQRETALAKQARAIRERLQAEANRAKREQEKRANEDRDRAIFHIINMLNSSQRKRFNQFGYVAREQDGEKILYGISVSESGEKNPRELIRLRDGWPEPGRHLQQSDLDTIIQQCKAIVQSDARRKKQTSLQGR